MATIAGSVQGVNTVDIHFPGEVVYDGDVIDYSIKCTGSGSNTLTVKIQQRRDGIGWKTLAKHKLDLPSDTASGRVTVDDLFDDLANEIIRFRLARDLGTQAVDYTITYDVQHS